MLVAFLPFVQLHNISYNQLLGIAPGAPRGAGLHFGGGGVPTVAFTKLIHVARFVNFESQTGFLNSLSTAAAGWGTWLRTAARRLAKGGFGIHKSTLV